MSDSPPLDPPPPSSLQAGAIPPTGGLGPLAPLDPDPLEDQLQAIFVPLLQLPGDLVRPRFQGDAPNQPPLEVDWAAVGPVNQQPENSAVISMEPEDQTLPGALPGAYIQLMKQHESFDVLISCYGPGSRQRLDQMRAMLLIGQNRWPMRAVGMAIQDLGVITNVSYLTAQELTLPKHDLTLRMRRVILRRFRVYNLLSAPVRVLPHPPI
jgi:hypothetical protein